MTDIKSDVKEKKRSTKIPSANRIARMGVFVALAMIFSYVEVLIPIPIAIPGIKLGIANLVVVIGLYLFSPGEVFLISLVRILLMGFLFGNASTLFYSLMGGVLSFLIMLLCRKFSGLSIVGVSVAGAVGHNLGQLGAAAVVLGSTKILGYLPVLLVAGVVTGFVIGVISQQSIRVLRHIDGL